MFILDNISEIVYKFLQGAITLSNYSINLNLHKYLSKQQINKNKVRPRMGLLFTAFSVEGFYRQVL
jgi:hypothetical protein